MWSSDEPTPTPTYFDAHIRTEALTDEVLENLVYFNIRDVLVAAHAPHPFHTAGDLLAYFQGLVNHEVPRLERAGLSPVIALGVHPDAVPRRSHHEIWRELPKLLGAPTVVAIGELGLDRADNTEMALLERQLALAKSLGLAALVTATGAERARKVRQILELVSTIGMAPDRVLVNHVDYTSLRTVLAAGCWAGVTVGPLHLGTDDAADMLARYRDDAVGRVILNSGLRLGPADVLALPKVALSLAQQGFSPTEVHRLVAGNAFRVFGARRPHAAVVPQRDESRLQ